MVILDEFYYLRVIWNIYNIFRLVELCANPKARNYSDSVLVASLAALRYNSHFYKINRFSWENRILIPNACININLMTVFTGLMLFFVFPLIMSPFLNVCELSKTVIRIVGLTRKKLEVVKIFFTRNRINWYVGKFKKFCGKKSIFFW